MTLDELLAELRRMAGDQGLGADTPLFSTGTIDSLGMVQLIGFVEDRAGVRVGAADVTLENFDSAARIMAYVAAT